MNIAITGLAAGLKARISAAIAHRFQYPETVFDPSTPEFIPDPNDPEAEIMVPLEDRQKPNPQTKWQFVEEVLKRFVGENLGGYEEEVAVQANNICRAAREKANTDLGL